MCLALNIQHDRAVGVGVVAAVVFFRWPTRITTSAAFTELRNVGDAVTCSDYSHSD
jgi:hypothetical protein